ncbi:ABC transporter permease [Bacteroides heparinolyticus]|uniref:ABC transporter permease n=1 Tax=Prevotella heparinolytica TaxID=28113 RepID=UPI0035A181A3
MLKLAWLNLWRNARRTCITTSSVCFAVFFCILMNSVYTGIWNAAMQNVLRIQKGHIEIHHKTDGEDDSADNFMSMSEETLRRLSGIPGVSEVLPRIETFAMASSGDFSQGVAVFGVYPSQEKQRMDITSMLVQGSYLAEQDEGVLVGEKLSRKLNLRTGDTIAMIGKGYHGTSAVGLFPVRGIASLPVSAMDRSTVYMSLKAAQEFIGLPHGYSCVHLWIDQEKHLAAIQNKVEALLPADEYDVQNWRDAMTELLAYSESTRAIGLAVNFILYLLVGSGILGTVIMLVNERRYEFGMMIALGMRRGRLALTLFCELLLIMGMGSAAAVALVWPIIHHFSRHAIPLKGNSAELIKEYITNPEFTCYTGGDLFAEQILVVLLISGLIILYPTFTLFRLKVNQVLKQ